MSKGPTRAGRFLFALAMILAFVTFSSVVMAQDADTIYDEADVLSDPEEEQVQEEFDQAAEEAGQPLYAFLVPDTGVDSQEARQALVTREAREANVPQDAGVIVVAPNDGWAQSAFLDGVSEEAVYEAMVLDFREGDYAAGLVAGAAEIQGEPVAQGTQSDPGGLPAGGILLLLALLAGVAVLLRSRRRNRQRLEDDRRIAEEEFANLTSRINEFDERERLVAGYLEAQRSLLDQETEGWVEAQIEDARTAGFGQEFNEAAGRLATDPATARERMENGNQLLEGALEKLRVAETTIDDYRAADETLDGKLRAAAQELDNTERAEEEAREAGVFVEHLDLRSEYDRLAKEAAGRAARRDEYDPRRAVAGVDALMERARERQSALRDEVTARTALPEERSLAEDALGHARETHEEYGRIYSTSVKEWGPAALEGAPAPEELSTDLRHAAGAIERAERAEAAGRFAESRSLLGEAANLSREVMQAPRKLKAAAVEADRKKREGEEKLKELETRLERAKANEHLMDPYQRQRLREYEYQLQNARYGFFGADWLTALLVFEALDNDYMYMGDPSAMSGEGSGEGGSGDGDDWGGGDWGGGDWGGGDFGGGDFGGGGW
ncbi:MAG: TPM domain-containing protein [Actinomycetota bacterium]|nr:TPM domain-containing protein [Actinomycetota bacterium]